MTECSKMRITTKKVLNTSYAITYTTVNCQPTEMHFQLSLCDVWCVCGDEVGS